MSKYLRSEYVFSAVLIILLAATTALFLVLAPTYGQFIITGFYASFIAPLVAAFKSKYEKDKAIAQLKNGGKDGKDQSTLY